MGVETVNQIQDNLQAMHDQLAEAHGTEHPNGASSPWESLGVHNAPWLPKSVIHVRCRTTPGHAGMPAGASYDIDTVSPLVSVQSAGLRLTGSGHIEIAVSVAKIKNLKVIPSLCVTSYNSGFKGDAGLSTTLDTTALTSGAMIFARHAISNGQETTSVFLYDITKFPWVPVDASFTLAYYGDFA